MIAMRHRIEYGTTEDQYADVAIAFREHAIRNPNAVMRTPMTRADHHASRMIAEPLRLFDCNIETDGAGAMIVTSRQRARDLRQPPVVIRAGAMAAGSHHIRLSNLFARAFADESPQRTARRLFAMADRVFSKRFHHGRLTPAPLEGLAVVADYNPATGEVTIWTSSQTPHLVRSVLTGPLRMPESSFSLENSSRRPSRLTMTKPSRSISS